MDLWVIGVVLALVRPPTAVLARRRAAFRAMTAIEIVSLVVVVALGVYLVVALLEPERFE